MIDELKKLISKNIKDGSEIFVGQPIDFDTIKRAEKALDVKFSDSYISFLHEFGTIEVDHRFFAGLHSSDVGKNGDVVAFTKYLREDIALPLQYVALDFQDGDYVLSLDTANFTEHECPVVLVDPVTREQSIVNRSFSEFLIGYLKA